MVGPVRIIAFVIAWHLIVGFVNGLDPTVPDAIACDILDVITGCSDTFTGFTLGTIESAPPELNLVLLFIDFVILCYLVVVVIKLARGVPVD